MSPRRPGSPLRVAASLAVFSALGLAGCATSRVDVEWTAPDLAAHSGLLRSGDVLVACEAPDVAIRNVCQEQLAAQVSARGARPVFVGPDTRLVTDRALDEQLLPGARSSNSKSVLVVSLRPVASDANGSGFSVGFGGFGFGRGSALGVGLAAPVGSTRVMTGFSANGRVTDVSTGRLVWTASAAAPPSEDLGQQFADLSSAVLDSAARAGLF